MALRGSIMGGQPASYALIVVERVQKTSSLPSESHALCQCELNPGSPAILNGLFQHFPPF
jgi:hypothetical protein